MIAATNIRAAVAQYLTDKGIGVEWTFIPFSQSRNNGEKSPSLNYKATITRNGKPVKGLASVDYMMGCANAPSYKQGDRSKIAEAIILAECEAGRQCASNGLSPYPKPNAKPIHPDIADLFYSLVSDSDAIDYPTFEDWAAEFGYDTDSRKAEGIYHQCVKIGLALRSLLGDTGMGELRDMLQDY